MFTRRYRLLICLGIGMILLAASCEAAKLKALIIDGQNNHTAWPKMTIMMKQYLEETRLFEVDVARTRFIWKVDRFEEFLPLAGVGPADIVENPRPDPDFKPAFGNYDVVISNFGFQAADWPEATQKSFEEYVENGGGFVVVHAASNCFPDWEAYNLMTGLGGWGGRNAKSGPYVYYNNEGQLIRDTSPGRGGAHGPAHVFPITIRVPDHPITKGMPEVWLTAKDECYALLRGPAKNMTILATGKDQTNRAPSDRHEPALMVVDYGKGRVFHTILGHNDVSLEGVGFIVSFVRGTEWAATGKVTLPVPDDFPTAEKSTVRKFKLNGSK